MRGKKPREVAAREAFEEAGLLGSLIGNFHYAKELASGKSIPCQVKVFLLLVEQQLDDWPEREQRETRWFGAVDAVALVDKGRLAEILRHERFRVIQQLLPLLQRQRSIWAAAERRPSAPRCQVVPSWCR
jgi:8-oxo-dGTP pyrophosphatase MutT (NUDIX family)